MRELLIKLRKGAHSLAFLNSAQFLGALNDNIFKMVVIFLLIQKEGADQANYILALVSALFVAPFILFSSTAGFLADRFSKQKLLQWLKVAEMGLMLLAMIAFGLESSWASRALLFVLATHSALFGPSKYGIIPELVSNKEISKANGLITSFTYLAIILGTFLGAFLTEISHRNFVLIAGFLFLIALSGFISTLGIKTTKPQNPNAKFNPFFIREIFRTLVDTKKIEHLLTAIFGSAFFLFIGAYVQINIIPFALGDLHLNDIAGGYLFLATALGIACGSFLAGLASKKQVELGLPCFAGLGIFLFLELLALFSHHLPLVILFLVLLGICGGAFIVPFDTFIQTVSPNNERGQIIGAANFLSFIGVLLASLFLYFFSVLLQLTATQGFALMGILSLLGTCLFALRLSDLSFAYLARHLINPFIHLKNEIATPIPSHSLLLLEDATPLKALLLLIQYPHIHFLLPNRSKWTFCYSIHTLPSDLSSLPYKQKEAILYCLYLKKERELGSQALLKSIPIQIIKTAPLSWTVRSRR